VDGVVHVWRHAVHEDGGRREQAARGLHGTRSAYGDRKQGVDPYDALCQERTRAGVRYAALMTESSGATRASGKV